MISATTNTLKYGNFMGRSIRDARQPTYRRSTAPKIEAKVGLFFATTSGFTQGAAEQYKRSLGRTAKFLNRWTSKKKACRRCWSSIPSSWVRRRGTRVQTRIAQERPGMSSSTHFEDWISLV